MQGLTFACFLMLLTNGNDFEVAEDEAGAPVKDGRIWYGMNARLGQFPYQAFLAIRSVDKTTTYCGGSLISPEHVLTAGHCCIDVKMATVYLGLVNLLKNHDANVVKINVQNIFVHEEYDPVEHYNDICVMKLSSAVEMNEKIKIIALPSHQNSNPSQYDSMEATVSGWGQTHDFEFSHPILQYAHVRIETHQQCFQHFYYDERLSTAISRTQICSGKIPWSGPCPGDSGGALAINDSSGNMMVIGIVSFGDGICSSLSPVVFTYVPAFLDWIKERMD